MTFIFLVSIDNDSTTHNLNGVFCKIYKDTYVSDFNDAINCFISENPNIVIQFLHKIHNDEVINPDSNLYNVYQDYLKNLGEDAGSWVFKNKKSIADIFRQYNGTKYLEIDFLNISKNVSHKYF